MRILVVSPHPDDELLGAGATLLMLAAAGHQVIVYPVTLGRPGTEQVRRMELQRSCQDAGFELLDVEPLAMSVGAHDDLHAGQRLLRENLAAHLDGVALVVAPSARDGHPTHEAISVAVAEAIEDAGSDRRLWLWSVWGQLPHPTLYVTVTPETLDQQISALAEHRSQLRRTDYIALVRGRALAMAVLGPELLFGFGIDVDDDTYAELLCEVDYGDHVWRSGPVRRLDIADPLPPVPPGHLPVGSWVR